MFFLLKSWCKFTFLVAILMLHACSESSTEPDAVPVPLEGYFLDNAVIGARYVTPSFSGETGYGGAFSYFEGETVEFYVGDIFLGAALGRKYITPRDFSNNPLRKPDEFYLPDDHTINIVRFLQTIDSDGIVEINDITGFLSIFFDNNNITITTATTEVAQGLSLDFQQTVSDFETSIQVENTIATLTAPLSQNEESRILVSTNKALAHYTRTLNHLYGQEINWQSYLNPRDHQNSIYLLEENINGSIQSREVALSYFTSLYGDYPVWVKSWSDNWKPQTEDYFLQEFEMGVRRVGGVNEGNQYTYPAPEQVFYPKIINNQWIINPDYRLPSDALRKMKIIPNQYVSTPYQDYDRTLKVTIVDESNNLRETQWYAANIGLVKLVSEKDSVTSTVYLISQQQLTQIPVTIYNEKFLASREIFEHSETQKAHIEGNLDSAFAALYLAMLLSGDRGTDKHRELFHTTYAIYVAEYTLSLTSKIIESSQQYALEAVTIEEIYNDARLFWVVNIVLTAVLHNIENSELIDKVLADTATIFQESMNLLTNASILDVDINLKPITSSDLE